MAFLSSLGGCQEKPSPGDWRGQSEFATVGSSHRAKFRVGPQPENLKISQKINSADPKNKNSIARRRHAAEDAVALRRGEEGVVGDDGGVDLGGV